MAGMWEELRKEYLKDELRASLRQLRYDHLTDRAKHPRAQAIQTPKGEFPSASLAAEAHGITRQHAARLARIGKDGWALMPRAPRRSKFGLLFGVAIETE